MRNSMLTRLKYALCCIVPTLLLWGCDYARMKEQEAVQTYGEEFPEMPAGTMPTEGGLEAVRTSDPETLRNPLPFTAEWVARGKEQYGFYCVMCHGPDGDGRGTVGQSFYPLPTDLRSLRVQDQSDGAIFHKVSLGSGRTPPLAYTVAEQDRWAIIHYIRSLVRRPEG